MSGPRTIMLRLSLAGATAALLAASFPRFDLAPLAWVGLAPLLVALSGLGPAAAFGLALASGLAFYMGLFAWILVIKGLTAVDFVLLGLYLGSYWGIFGLSLRYLTVRGRVAPVLAAPVLWVSLEYLRSQAGFLALPWGLLGQSQYSHLAVIQVASLTGVYGVSFVMVMVTAALGEAVPVFKFEVDRRWGRARLVPQVVAAALVLGLTLAYGWHALAGAAATETVRLAVIQGNIPQAVKWEESFRQAIINQYRTLTRQAARQESPSLIIWPESALPGLLPQDSQILEVVCALARETGTPLLLGSAQRPKSGPPEWTAAHRYNGAFLISAQGGVQDYYHKIRLLPFAEYLPHRESWPWPARLTQAAGNFIPGERATIFQLKGVKFGALICWENIFPELTRRFAAQGAAFLVNVTNEAWFGDTAAPYQFLMMSVFRAVEHRVGVARAANTGISCFIDPWGRVLGRVAQGGRDIFMEGSLTLDLPLVRQTTFYTRYGDLFAQLNLLTAAGLAVFSACRRPGA